MLGGLGALPSYLFLRHHPFAGMLGATPEFAKMIALQQKMVASPAGELMVVIGVVGLLAGAWGLYCGIRVLSSKSGARIPFRKSVVALGVTESLGLVMGAWLHVRNVKMMNEFVDMLAHPGPRINAGFEETMKTFFQAFAVVGMAFAIGMAMLKLLVLFWAHHYTGKREVVEYLDR
jgi:hypothetical protein